MRETRLCARWRYRAIGQSLPPRLRSSPDTRAGACLGGRSVAAASSRPPLPARRAAARARRASAFDQVREPCQRVVPLARNAFEPVVGLGQPLEVEAPDALATGALAAREPGAGQHPQVLGD